MSPVVARKEPEAKRKPTSVLLPADVVGDLARITAETGQSRNEAIVQLLRHAIRDHFAQGRRPKR